jgi:hypothetical protein
MRSIPECYVIWQILYDEPFFKGIVKFCLNFMQSRGYSGPMRTKTKTSQYPMLTKPL